MALVLRNLLLTPDLITTLCASPLLSHCQTAVSPFADKKSSALFQSPMKDQEQYAYLVTCQSDTALLMWHNALLLTRSGSS
jgi:hypothetical protein